MQVVCSKEEYKKYNVPWYRGLFRIRAWCSPEAGMAYLERASQLTYDELR